MGVPVPRPAYASGSWRRLVERGWTRCGPGTDFASSASWVQYWRPDGTLVINQLAKRGADAYVGLFRVHLTPWTPRRCGCRGADIPPS